MSSPDDSGAPERRSSPRAVLIGGFGSLVLLGGALLLQGHHSVLLKLPGQWLVAAAVPVLIGLLVGGYIKKVSVGSVAVEAPDLKPLKFVAPDPARRTHAAVNAPADSWTSLRAAEYLRTSGLMVAHVYKPSDYPGMKYDVSIYLLRHGNAPAPNQTTGFTDIARAEFFFGDSWGNQIFTSTNDGGVIGVNTSAWGTFLATCRVSFSDDKEPVVLQRYIDFEMASPARTRR